MVASQFQMYFDDLRQNPGATPDKIRQIEESFHIMLPEDYKNFLSFSNGAHGNIGISNYLDLWNVSDVISLNQEYMVQENIPGLILFGSNGANEAYGYNFNKTPIEIVQIPLILMIWEDAMVIGKTFTDFLDYLHQGP
jgi:hypothetical protein